MLIFIGIKNTVININLIIYFFFCFFYIEFFLELNETFVNNINIRERRLNFAINNTYKYINTNGKGNFINLTKKENILFFKGTASIDNYLNDELCAFIFELIYNGKE